MKGMNNRMEQKKEFDGRLLLVTTLLISICSIIYELIISSMSTYLNGDSIKQYSITIGLYMSAMGIGSYISKYIKNKLFNKFIYVEILTGVLGGFSTLILFLSNIYTNIYYLIMYLLIIFIGVLVGLEIPLLTRIIEENNSNIRTNLANIFTFDYIGGLIGSIAFPLLLFPKLGFITTSILVGTINIFVSLLIMFKYRIFIYKSKLIRKFIVIIFVILFIFLLSGDKITKTIEGGLYRDDVIYSKQTMYQKIVMTKHKDDVRLFLDGNLQFSSIDEYRYHESLVHVPFLYAEKHDRVLVLGGGDGLAVREILKYEDVNEIVLPMLAKIIEQIKDQCLPHFTKYKPTRIVLTGGGAEIDGLRDFIENAFAVVTELLPPDATVRALSEYVWNGETVRRQNYIARHDRWRRRTSWIGKFFRKKARKTQKFVPILPSTLSFDMRRAETYSLFRSGAISMIHVDIMDGFYVDRIVGGIDELKNIRTRTNAHLHVHLMTESPVVWAEDAIAAGADTVILSTNTSGLKAAIRNVKAAGRRVGVALHPDSEVSLLKPILREIDEVLVMSVMPGAAGQTFEPGALHKIAVLAGTRKKYGLRFVICVDGGINDKTAQLCWEAGADLLVSGSYLARASDFPLAVQSLLKKHAV